MNDYIVCAIAANATIRGFATQTTELVEKARHLHGLSPVSTAALGRTLTAAVIMSKQLQNNGDALTIQIRGNGPLGGIVAVSDSNANVRGYVYNPTVDLPLNKIGKLDVSGAVGTDGYINVIKDIGLKRPYIGYVKLESGEIAEDLAKYFLLSEQTPSHVSLGVLVNTNGSVKKAGGIFVQIMPGVSDEDVNLLEANLNSMKSVTSLLDGGISPEQMLETAFDKLGMKMMTKDSCSYECPCSRERMERNLISLGRIELESMAKEQENTELECHFCNEKYIFTTDDIKNILKKD
jgi:molecular chaperone Hsp33